MASPSSPDELGGRGRHAWEQAGGHAWAVGIEEDEEGRLQFSSENGLQKWKAKAKQRDGRTIRRGMIRYVYLVLDKSAPMLDGDADMQPSRVVVMQGHAREFIRRFFDENPISSLGVIVSRNGAGEHLTGLSGNPKVHLRALEEDGTHCRGVASIQNSLEMAMGLLKTVPRYGTKEVLLLYGSLTTSDPGDIHDTAQRLKDEGIRVSVINLLAEIYICKQLAEVTGGDHRVIMDVESLRTHLGHHVTPPPAPVLAPRAIDSQELVRMGFPSRVETRVPSFGFSGEEEVLCEAGYLCPRCSIKTTDLPSTCMVCSLPLVSSPQLARSYHHLFPVPLYESIAYADVKAAALDANGAPLRCEGCFEDLGIERGPDVVRLRCPECRHTFCWDCDTFIHDQLHVCPTCSG